MKTAWEKYSAETLKNVEKLSKEYMEFLSECKTERECVDWFIKDAEKQGFRDMDEIIEKGISLKPGDRVYRNNMGKSLVMYVMGEEPLSKGMNILGAHLDSPRIDLKPNPLYEDGNLALLDTHYYGGIKKYLWVTIPLALHGVIVKRDGTKVTVNIGEKPEDPVFFISDLLIHLSKEQLSKEAAKVVEGEALDIICGSRPVCICPDEKEKGSTSEELVKKGVLDILKREYGVEEKDFLTAEIEAVPAGPAREAGFDRSLILAYGHDDRICAYTSYAAMLEAGKQNRTSCLILADKEEIGNVGATGMESKFFENTTAELIEAAEGYNELKLRRCLANSCMLSNDVTGGYDPIYAGSFEKKNTAFMGCGLAIAKYTGGGGKGGASDANAEYVAKILSILDDADVSYQLAELGRVDLGGGGTISYVTSLYGMEIIDCGVALLNMHAPWEAASKADIYETEKACEAFLKSCNR